MFKISIRHPYSIGLLLAAVIILGVGIRFRPAKKSAPSPLSESDISRVLQRAQSQQLVDLSRYLSDAAENARTRLLYLKSIPHTAVIWDDEHAVTDSSGGPKVAPIGAHGAEIRLKLAPLHTGVPFAVVVAPALAHPDVQTAVPVLPNGEWVIAVARSSEDQIIFAHGLYQGTTSAHCGGFEYQQISSSAVLSDALAGGGLFTLQGLFLGVIFSCHGQLAVASVESIASVLHQPVSIADRIQQSIGLGLTDLIDREGAASGVRVNMVWNGTPGKLAGVEPGDVLLEVNGQAVRSISDLGPLAQDENRSPQTLTILRGRRTLKIGVPAGDSDLQPGTIAAGGVTFISDPVTSQTRIQSIAPNSAWAKAGVQPGDVLVRIGGVTIKNPEQAASLIASRAARSLTVAVQRDNAVAEVLVAHE